MSSPEKPYHQSYFTEADVPQPNVFETADGDIIPDPEAAEGYVTSVSDDQLRARSEADRQAAVDAMLSEAVGAAARQEIRDWGTRKLREDYNALYAQLQQARAANDGSETARLWALVNKKADEIQMHQALVDGSNEDITE